MTASEAAAEAVRLVQARPIDARALARSALAEARAHGDLASASTAERALGLVAKELNDTAAAVVHLRSAVRLGERAGDPLRAAQARMSLSLVLAHRGSTAKALQEADLACAMLTGLDGARAQMQRALVLQHVGRGDEALAGYRRALVVLRRSHDRLWEMRLLSNRGVLHTYRGEFKPAEADLVRAEALATELGLDLGIGLVRHNLGFLFARQGDVPAALRWYDRADEAYREGGTRPARLLDRCELLLSVRLVAEARHAAEQAVEDFTSGRDALRAAEARLQLSRAALLDGDETTARSAAEGARRAFSRQGRGSWAALARYAVLSAAWEAGERSPALLALARRASTDLAAAGWGVAALDARVLVARIALDLGRVKLAAEELAGASRARHRGPADARARAWHAEALLCLARGERPAAEAALGSGMNVIEQYRATLGATELRSHVAGHGADLAAAGLRLALDDGDARRVFAWSERWRGGALMSRPVRPPDDEGLAADLAELRRVAADIGDVVLSGRDPSRLWRERVRLEDSVRRRCRQAPGDDRGPGSAPPGLDAVQADLGDRALIEILVVDGRHHAVVVTSGGVGLHALGAGPVADAELAALQFALRRLARPDRSPAAADAATRAAAHAAARLDRELLAPLAADIGDRPLVVVPTGALHALPWSVLPSCRGRPVTVAPSAALWRRAVERPPASPARVVLVAGPRLAHAAAEIDGLARRYPAAQSFLGQAAAVGPVLEALDGAALAHVAAHGRFRADNPLFSSLELVDGPLTVYDLESLGSAPRVLVLSACDSGLSAVAAGDELMGLAAALLCLGTVSVIGSVGAVPDAETARLMAAVHDHLQAGSSPAVALLHGQAAIADQDGPPSQRLAAAAGFVCLGAG